MFLPISAGLYTILAVCAISTFVLIHMDPYAGFPSHPQYPLNAFLLLINSVCIIYLLIWLAGIYLSSVISILL